MDGAHLLRLGHVHERLSRRTLHTLVYGLIYGCHGKNLPKERKVKLGNTKVVPEARYKFDEKAEPRVSWLTKAKRSMNRIIIVWVLALWVVNW
jgi:hypothetical protein